MSNGNDRTYYIAGGSRVWIRTMEAHVTKMLTFRANQFHVINKYLLLGVYIHLCLEMVFGTNLLAAIFIEGLKKTVTGKASHFSNSVFSSFSC